MIQEGVLKRMPDGTFRPEYFIKDHLGSVRVCYTDNPATPTPDVLQVNNYYPFGMSMTSSEGENAYKYNGKELYEDHGLDWYDYGWRNYDPAIARFTTQDRFAEKYYDFSPYQYAANNPILYIDVNGDSIYVADQYRENMQSSLEEVYGDNAKDFGYTESGMLVYNGDKKSLSKDQKKVFKGMNKVMGEETTTNVVFEETYDITTKDGQTVTVDTKNHGGGVSVNTYESNVSENYVIVDPNAPTSFTVDKLGPAFYDGTPTTPENYYMKPVQVQSNSEITFYHEVGHIIYRATNQSKVIDYDNKARKAMGMSPRPYDNSHHKYEVPKKYGN